jgi:hypothetical protein
MQTRRVRNRYRSTPHHQSSGLRRPTCSTGRRFTTSGFHCLRDTFASWCMRPVGPDWQPLCLYRFNSYRFVRLTEYDGIQSQPQNGCSPFRDPRLGFERTLSRIASTGCSRSSLSGSCPLLLDRVLHVGLRIWILWYSGRSLVIQRRTSASQWPRASAELQLPPVRRLSLTMSTTIRDIYRARSRQSRRSSFRFMRMEGSSARSTSTATTPRHSKVRTVSFLKKWLGLSADILKNIQPVRLRPNPARLQSLNLFAPRCVP